MYCSEGVPPQGGSHLTAPGAKSGLRFESCFSITGDVPWWGGYLASNNTAVVRFASEDGGDVDEMVDFPVCTIVLVYHGEPSGHRRRCRCRERSVTGLHHRIFYYTPFPQ